MTDILKALQRDAVIIEALHVARYQLVIHHGHQMLCEGEEFPMDFTQELKRLDEVMTMLGVDLTEPLPAPEKWSKDEPDEDADSAL